MYKIKNNMVRKRLYQISKYALLVLLSYQLLYPVLFIFSMAIRNPIDAYDPSVIWIPKNLSLTGFIDAFRSMKYLDALKTSLAISIGSSILDVISCSLAGYGFARYKFPGKNILFACVILTLIVPMQTIMLPSYMNMKEFTAGGILPTPINMIGSNWTFYLPSLLGSGIRSGLYIYIFRQFFESMSSSLEEAAYVDGSGPFKTFLHIMLPNAKNAIISVFLFSFVWHFNDFYKANQFLGTKRKTLIVALSSLRVDLSNYVGGQTISDPLRIVTRMQAGCLLAIIPMLILFIISQNYFSDSIEHMGIK